MRGALTRNVVLLGIASFLADVSGEMLLAVFPFLLLAQGATGLGIGLVGGLTDAAGHIIKPITGRLADRSGRRRPFIVAGYLTAALARFGIALATSWPGTLAFRLADRAGKGLRTAPRDALLAESVEKGARGRAFGFHRAADTAGAVVGVGIAWSAIVFLEAEPALVVLTGAFIGLLTLIPLSGVREAASPASSSPHAHGPEPAHPQFAVFVALAGVFALANVSYMFFLLRAAEDVGSVSGAVALYLFFNVVYVAFAYPAGRLADVWGRPRVLAAGWALFAIACAIFAWAPQAWAAQVGFFVLGVAFASTEGVGRALAADLAGSRARGSGLGVFHAVVGLGTVVGSASAGWLWDRVGPWASFVWGAAIAATAAAALTANRRRFT